MQEIGEELIDLNEDNKKIKEENNTDKITNKSSINYIIILIILIILFVIIIKLYSFFNKMNPKKQYKSLIIFDFDKTITVNDTFEEQVPLLNSKADEEDLIRRIYDENWASVMAEAYNTFYDLNISISDINKRIDKVQITSGMKELLNFLKNKKDNNYFLVIFSAGHLYQVNRVLQKNNLTSFFDDIIAFYSYEKDGKIIVDKPKEFSCELCKGVGQCKTNEFNLLKKKYEKENIFFDKIYYICDGINDYCLARNLENKDELLIRKNYGLDNYLYKDNFIQNIKCKVNKWNNGFDIIDFFKNEKN